MTRQYQNFISGTLSSGLAPTDTTMSSTGLGAMEAVSNPGVIYVVLDPAGVDGAPEVIHVVAHSASATTATVQRSQEGSTARTHNSGTAWVAAVTAADLERFDVIEASSWVTSTRIADGAVTTAKIATGAVTAGKLAAGVINAANLFATDVVDSSAIAAGAVGASEIADGAVGTAELADNSVTAAKIAADAVGSSEIAAGAVGTAELADASVTSAKLSGSVEATPIDGSVTLAKLTSGMQVIQWTEDIFLARYNGTTNGSGVYNVTHGLGSEALRRILSVQGFYKGNSGEAVPFTPYAIDATIIYSSGLTASRSAYLIVMYTDLSVSTW